MSSIPGEGHTHATLWNNGAVTDLGLLPGEGGIFAGANGINSTDEVTGSGDNKESMERAFLWRNGTMTDIGTLGGPRQPRMGSTTQARSSASPRPAPTPTTGSYTRTGR
jgi:probable HAF family extracellular repeat protein